MLSSRCKSRPEADANGLHIGYRPLFLRCRKSVKQSSRGGALSRNSSFTPISPTRKQYGFFTLRSTCAARCSLGIVLSKASPDTSTKSSLLTVVISTPASSAK